MNTIDDLLAEMRVYMDEMRETMETFKALMERIEAVLAPPPAPEAVVPPAPIHAAKPRKRARA